MVLIVGDTTAFAPGRFPGVQTYPVPPPIAVRVADEPAQILPDEMAVTVKAPEMENI
jgi:hypothetical protein